MPLLVPPQYESIPPKAPLVFLIGPIQGTSDWQTPTAQWLLGKITSLYVFSPRSGMWGSDISPKEHDRLFKEQERWEHTHIGEVMRRILDRPKGVARAAILAWCAKEEVHNPKRAYAQTTRYEIGKMLGWLSGGLGRSIFLDPDPFELPDGIFIGADAEFSGRRYLQIDLNNDKRRLYDSLEETREEVLKYLQEK